MPTSQLHTQKFFAENLNASVFTIDVATNLTLFALIVDNTGNTVDVFVKIWFAASSPTVGTTDPDIILRVEASQKQDFPIADGFGFAAGASNNMYFACVTAGGTAGATAPTNAVEAEIFTS